MENASTQYVYVYGFVCVVYISTPPPLFRNKQAAPTHKVTGRPIPAQDVYAHANTHIHTHAHTRTHAHTHGRVDPRRAAAPTPSARTPTSRGGKTSAPLMETASKQYVYLYVYIRPGISYPTLVFSSGASRAGIGRPGTLCVGAAGRSAAICCVWWEGGSRGKLNTHTNT